MRPGPSRRARWAAVLVCTLLATSAAGAAPAAADAAGDPAARAARTIKVVETVSLRLVKKSGSRLVHRGTATGTLPGKVRARFTFSAVRVTGRVTVYTRGGSLTIRVKGYPRSTGVNARFGGRMAVVRGTGRYSGARGRGTFNGVVNRRSWAAAVSAAGRMRY